MQRFALDRCDWATALAEMERPISEKSAKTGTKRCTEIRDSQQSVPFSIASFITCSEMGGESKRKRRDGLFGRRPDARHSFYIAEAEKRTVASFHAPFLRLRCCSSAALEIVID